MKLIDANVLIVGAGPAGLAAAIELRKSGIDRIVVVDREKVAGGIPRFCNHIGFGIRDMRRFLTGPAYAARYVRLASEMNVDLHTQTTITGWENETQLNATRPDGLITYKANAIVLATGCRERPRSARLIPGSRPAGVFTTGSLQRFVYEHHHPVGKRAIVVGADHVGFSCVLTLKHADADVIAMITEHPRHQSFFAYKLLSADRHRVPVYTNMKVINIFGKRRVEAVELMDVHSGATQQLPCDTVVFTGDWIPDYELSHYGGLAMDPSSNSPLVDLNLGTSVGGVFAAGNLIHAAETADRAALSGRYAAEKVAQYLRGDSTTSDHDQIKIEHDETIQWVSPHVIREGQRSAPSGVFTLRVSGVSSGATIEVWQGEHQLYRQRFRRLIPNLPVYLPDKWLRFVDTNDAPVQIRVTQPA